jgi:hypothetical protein
MLAAYYVGAYVLSVLGGYVLVGTCMYLMRRTVGLERPFFEWLDLYVGGTERLVATTLVILAPSYLPAFIGGWVVLKLASNWQRLPGENPKVRKGNLLALIGSVLSFTVAIGFGLLIHPEALKIWMK